jgi:hypothetical protein
MKKMLLVLFMIFALSVPMAYADSEAIAIADVTSVRALYNSDCLISVDGAADNAVTGSNLLGSSFKYNTVDNSAWYDGTSDSLYQEKLSLYELPNITHAGTGAEVQAVYSPGYSPSAYINEAGHQVRYIIDVTKTGSTASAVVTARLGTVFIASFGMAATDVALRVEVNVYTTGVSTQKTVSLSTASPSSGVATPANVLLKQTDETVNLSVVSNSLVRFGVDAAVGDSITFVTSKVYSDISGYGV